MKNRNGNVNVGDDLSYDRNSIGSVIPEFRPIGLTLYTRMSTAGVDQHSDYLHYVR